MEERTQGLLAAFRVIVADAFHSSKENPCRETDVRNAVGEALKYTRTDLEKMSDRWSQWLRGLPKSAGRIRPREVEMVNEWLGRRGYLPPELLVRLDDIVPDATFWSQCAASGTTPADLTEMRACFVAPDRAYHIFRYTIGDPDRIAVGQLSIRSNSDTDAISTHERYKVKNRTDDLSGFLFRHSDGSFRISSNNCRTNSAQIAMFRNLVTYTGSEDLGFKGNAKRLIGTFLDRHDSNFFYTGKIVIRRIDSNHHQLPLGTLSESQLKSYDATILDDLHMQPELIYKNLFTFRF